jgi:hypothetical protein
LLFRQIFDIAFEKSISSRCSLDLMRSFCFHMLFVFCGAKHCGNDFCVSAVHWDRKSMAVTRPLARPMPCFFVVLGTNMLAATLVPLTLTVYRRNFSHAVARTVAGFDAVPEAM